MVITHRAHGRVRDIDREPSFLALFAFRVRQDAQQAGGRSELLPGGLVRDIPLITNDMLFTFSKLSCLLNAMRINFLIIFLARN